MKNGWLLTRTHELSSLSRAPYRLINDNSRKSSIIINSHTFVWSCTTYEMCRLGVGWGNGWSEQPFPPVSLHVSTSLYIAWHTPKRYCSNMLKCHALSCYCFSMACNVSHFGLKMTSIGGGGGLEQSGHVVSIVSTITCRRSRRWVLIAPEFAQQRYCNLTPRHWGRRFAEVCRQQNSKWRHVWGILVVKLKNVGVQYRICPHFNQNIKYIHHRCEQLLCSSSYWIVFRLHWKS